MIEYFFVFLFTVCTSIIFFFRIVRIHVLSLFFLVYNVHIKHFFLPYCKNLCTFFAFFGLQCVHQSFFFFPIVRIYILFFLFTACTLISFFFRIIRIYVLSLLFLIYSVHINHFFLFYGKNLYTFFVFFIYLQRTYQSCFSSISYYKNLCTFFRIRISVLIVLESILICFIGYFYNTKGKNMTYTHTKLLW